MRVQDERAIRKAARPILKAREFQVLMALAEFTDPKRRCFPRVSVIAHEAGCSASSVNRALASLESGGWITREERRRADGGQASNLITLHLPAEIVAKARADLLRLPLMRVISGGSACGQACGEPVDKDRPPLSNLTPSPPVKNDTPLTRPTSKDNLTQGPIRAVGDAGPVDRPEPPRHRPPPVSPAAGLQEEGVATAPLKRLA